MPRKGSREQFTFAFGAPEEPERAPEPSPPPHDDDEPPQLSSEEPFRPTAENLRALTEAIEGANATYQPPAPRGARKRRWEAFHDRGRLIGEALAGAPRRQLAGTDPVEDAIRKAMEEGREEFRRNQAAAEERKRRPSDDPSSNTK